MLAVVKPPVKVTLVPSAAELGVMIAGATSYGDAAEAAATKTAKTSKQRAE